jgi:hypothetical protein
VESYLSNEFEASLKIVASQGRILVKLIHQTGTTTYELVKHSKGGKLLV